MHNYTPNDGKYTFFDKYSEPGLLLMIEIVAPRKKKYGGSITFLEGKKLDDAVLYEEFFHAYQKENRKLYDEKEFNTEFEAKVATQLMQTEGNEAFPLIMGATNFSTYLTHYQENFIPLPFKTATSANFLGEYHRAANRYSNFNIKTKYGNQHYKTKTKQSPEVLIKLIRASYAK